MPFCALIKEIRNSRSAVLRNARARAHARIPCTRSDPRLVAPGAPSQRRAEGRGGRGRERARRAAAVRAQVVAQALYEALGGSRIGGSAEGTRAMNPKAGGEEEDCVDSGAETGGSDYSHLSSASSELSVEEAQDPFLVSIHIIADPGESQPLQEAIDKVLAWVHPDLPLFRVSERRTIRRRRKTPKSAQPALAVVLFLQEEYGEEQILQVHRVLQRPPWRHHHTERVHGRFIPYLPCSQDFFTLAPGTPLWAIRPVHYGKEIVRFTIYCRHNSYADSLRFYELILRRSPSQRKADFCIFPIFSNLDVDIQFSLKRLPCDQKPVPTDSSVLEFRVKDIGQLVPLLPNPCSPISEGRWQTEDHDGNKILLQAQRTHKKVPKCSREHHSSEKKPRSAPPTAIDTPITGQGSSQTALHDSPSNQMALLPGSKQEYSPQLSTSSPAWSFQRSKSLFCLPSGGPSPTEPQPLPTHSQRHSASEWKPSRLMSIDDLEGTQETDVDTGLRLSSSDLSVVSAYSAPSRFCNTVEASISSERCSSHWPAQKSPKKGPLPAASEVSPETACVPQPLFTKGSPSPAEMTTTGLSASGASLLTKSSTPPPCHDPKATQGVQDMLLPPTTIGPEAEDMEEFYI